MNIVQKVKNYWHKGSFVKRNEVSFLVNFQANGVWHAGFPDGVAAGQVRVGWERIGRRKVSVSDADHNLRKDQTTCTARILALAINRYVSRTLESATWLQKYVLRGRMGTTESRWGESGVGLCVFCCGFF